MHIKTVALKLHRPSAEKQKLLDSAFQRYTEALQFLLDHTEPLALRARMEHEGRFGARGVAALLDRELLRALNDFGVQPFKDSLKMEYAEILAGYFAMQNSWPDTGFPRFYYPAEAADTAFVQSVRAYTQGDISVGELGRFLRKLYAKQNPNKSMLFARYAAHRDYCLLYDREKDRYYAKLYLLSVRDAQRRGGISRSGRPLQYITKEGGMLEADNRHERYIVVPLEVGAWQRGFLEQALERPEMLATARLIRRGGAYYLLVHVRCAAPALIRAQAVMGVCRGMSGAVAYATYRQQQAAQTGMLSWLPRGRELTKNELHCAANEIADAAKEAQAQVVTYKLGSRGDGAGFQGRAPVLSGREFNRLVAVLAYKLRERGLPEPVYVSPRGLFSRCPECGRSSVGNRFRDGLFLCNACGFSGRAEDTAALSLSATLQRYKENKIVFHSRVGLDGVEIYNELLDVHFRCPEEDGALEAFYGALGRMMREGMGGRTQRSIWKKLAGYPDIRDGIVIVEDA